MASAAQLAARNRFKRASRATRKKWAAKAARTRARSHAENPYDVLGRHFDKVEDARLFAQQKSLNDDIDVPIMDKGSHWQAPWHLQTVKRGSVKPAYDLRGNPISYAPVRGGVDGEYAESDGLRINTVPPSTSLRTGRLVGRGRQQLYVSGNPCSYDNPTKSWVVTRKSTGEVIGEFYDKRNVEKFDPSKVRIETAEEYLGRVNSEIKSRRRPTANNPELLVWSTEGGSMLPVSANPGLEIEMAENPKKKRHKKRKSRKARGRRKHRGGSCHRVKSHRRCRKGGSRRRKHASHGRKAIKRGKKLLSWKAAVKRHGVKGAATYRRKFGVRKLKG